MNKSEFLKETEERLKWCRHLENHFHKAADSLPGYVLIRRYIRLLDSVLKECRDISKAYDAYFPDEWKAPVCSKNPNTGLSVKAASGAAGHPEDLRYLTSFGLRVRSKSEAILAELLYSHLRKTTAHKRGRWKVENGLP